MTPENGTSALPLSIGGHPDIIVSGPNGNQTIANPLFSYTFKPFNGSIFPQSPVGMPSSPSAAKGTLLTRLVQFLE
jgi:hypothetical protein